MARALTALDVDAAATAADLPPSARDRRLAAGLADDLERGFEALVVAQQHRLYAFALALTGQPQEAEEVAQDALLRAYRALATYPVERVRELAVGAWLHRIALNVQRNRWRRRTLRLAPIEAADGVADPAPEPARVAEAGEARRAVAALVARLPAEQREPVVLHHVLGYGYAEAAALLRRPVGTVKAQAHRGLARLRGWLELDREGAAIG